MSAMTTHHTVWMEKSPADARDARGAYAWFCSCGERGDWEHGADSAASAAARAGGREHLSKPGLTSYTGPERTDRPGRTALTDQWLALAEEDEDPPDGTAPGRRG